jgi:hypothetical protein
VTYLVTDPVANINLVFGFGRDPQTVIHPMLYLALEMSLLPVCVCWPTHLVLRCLFSHRLNAATVPRDGAPPDNQP